jgi:hypothetical protein
MSSLPALTVADVRAWTEPRYYERGEAYAREGRIQRPRRAGPTLKAFCQGSRPAPYRVELRLDADGIAEGTCSCPVGADGRCKHAVALLLTWIQTPAAVETVPALSERLADAPRDQLVPIIEQMVRRAPALEAVVDLALQDPSLDQADEVRAYVADAFTGVSAPPSDYGYARTVAEALDPLLERGLEAGADADWAVVVALFPTVARAVRDRLSVIEDEEGALLSVLDTCGAALGRALARMETDAPRAPVVDILVDLVFTATEAGARGLADTVGSPLRAQTTEAERQRVAARLRTALPDDPDADDPPPRLLGDLLLDLERDRLDADAFVDLCRRTGHWAACADRLLALDRPDDAVAAARHLPARTLPPLLDRLVAAEAADRARALVRDRLDTEDPPAVLQRWLYDHARDTGNAETALAVARRMFEARPSPAAFDRVLSAARALDAWEEVRPALFAFLEDTQRPALQVRLHLHEDAVDDALEVVEPFAGPERSAPLGVSVLAEVADAVGETRPEAALALYEECARRLSAERGRDRYARAAELLSRARALCETHDAPEAWRSILEPLREEELHRLPAARDELAKRDLLPDA